MLGSGAGAGGKTELVACEDTGTLAVRKTMPRDLANPEAWAALSKVSHPLIPRVQATGWRGSMFWVVYDFVPGDTLAELLRRCGPLDEQRAALLLRDVALAASALHAAGVVHRDISPGNVIVDVEGHAHLTDLGIARMVNGEATHDTTRLGTWGFAAPEQYGFAQTDARSDVFSMGRLLAFVCTGAMPEVVSEPLDMRGGCLSALSPEMAAVISKASAFEPSARYQSAQEFGSALEGFVTYIKPASRAGMVPFAEKLPPVRAQSSAAVAPQAESNAEDERPAPLLARIFGWYMVACMALAALVFVVGAFEALIVPGSAKQPIGTFVVGLLCAGICADWALNTAWALLRRRAYVKREGRIKRLFLSYLRAIGWFCAALLVIALIISAMSLI